jgi:hypothetical protein
MDAMEYGTLFASAKAEFDREVSSRRESIAHKRLALAREEERLRKAEEEFADRWHAMFLRLARGEPPELPLEPEALGSKPTVRHETGEPRRSKRRAFDAPLLQVALTLPPPFSAPQVERAWNKFNPENSLPRSTIKGALERHLEADHLELVNAGGRGNQNPRTYRVKGGNSPDAVSA